MRNLLEELAESYREVPPDFWDFFAWIVYSLLFIASITILAIHL